MILVQRQMNRQLGLQRESRNRPVNIPSLALEEKCLPIAVSSLQFNDGKGAFCIKGARTKLVYVMSKMNLTPTCHHI